MSWIHELLQQESCGCFTAASPCQIWRHSRPCWQLAGGESVAIRGGTFSMRELWRVAVLGSHGALYAGLQAVGLHSWWRRNARSPDALLGRVLLVGDCVNTVSCM